jgi:hypothetical protein
MKNKFIIPGGAASVNFREIRMGSIAPNMLYRSSHPIKDDRQDRVISMLAAQTRIASVLNLSDTNSGLKIKAFIAPWYDNLFKNGRVLALGMDFHFDSGNFRKKLKKALQFITTSEGPWLVHCHAGVDRTGFVSLVLEAFMGAATDEIINDYLMSVNSIYDSNIYGEINEDDPLVVMKMLSSMGDYLSLNDKNLQKIAENYLRNTIKLSAVETDLLREKLLGS